MDVAAVELLGLEDLLGASPSPSARHFQYRVGTARSEDLSGGFNDGGTMKTVITRGAMNFKKFHLFEVQIEQDDEERGAGQRDIG